MNTQDIIKPYWSNTNPVTIDDAKTTKVYSWTGPCKHTWKRQYSKMVTNQKCPYCTNRQVLQGYNDIATTHPHIAEQWHPTKNQYAPNTLTIGSGIKAWWVCNKGHQWEARINSRTINGCGVCSNHILQEGINDLATLHPKIAKQWSLNNKRNPQEYTAGSHEKVQWQCEQGHLWDTSIVERTRAKSGCPYCSGKQAMPGYNTIEDLAPHLVKEWNPNKNSHLDPSKLVPGSHVRAWWLCQEGHEWETKIEQRYREGTVCPKCSLRNVSKAEQELFQAIRKYIPTVQKNHKLSNGMQLDIYVPDRKIGIEYNGLYWHAESPQRTKTYHQEKTRIASEEGIQLIHIWEDDWKRNPNLIKNMIFHKLGVTNSPKVYARACEIRPTDNFETQEFLQKYHIQQVAYGKLQLGLYDNRDILQALIVARYENNNRTINILRYATATHVVGGFTKLLNQLKKEDVDNIVTFSDKSLSLGQLYSENGFEKAKELKPDYMYIYRNERKHKFNFRKQRFENDPQLKYEEGLTETQLADLNNLRKIWDAGKTKWELKVTQKPKTTYNKN